MNELLQFLSDLMQNNNREWFQENKSRYLETKNNHEVFVSKIIGGITALDQSFHLLKPSECIFRIYRDVRFSKNKDPYKTAFGAYFSKGGRKSQFAGYYLHIEPGNSFIGGGLWRPESNVLKSIRYEIYNFPDEFISISQEPEFKNRFGEIKGEKLKNPPKGFPVDFGKIELLKFKSFTVMQSFSDQQLLSDNFYPELMKTFSTMTPFIEFLNRGIEFE